MANLDKGITHLPISSWKDPKLGYYTLPGSSHTLSKSLGYENVFSASNLNTKLSVKLDETGSFTHHLEFLNEIGIQPDKVWTDSENIQLGHTAAFIEQGLTQGWIYMADKETYLCSCGKVEFLATEEALHPNNNQRTIYHVSENGTVTCNICHQVADKAMRKCLIMRFPDNNVDIDVYPNYGEKEFNELWESFRGRETLISRIGERSIEFPYEGENFFIDSDLSWLPFLHVLQTYHMLQVDSLLTVHRTIKQAVLSLMVAKLAGNTLPSSLMILPRLDIDFGDNEELRAQSLLQQYGPLVVRLFLDEALGSSKKDLVIPSSLAYWITASLKKIDKDQLDSITPTIDQFYQEPVYNWLPQALKKLRQEKYQDLTNLQKWLITNLEC